MITCPNCGELNEPGSRFCFNCGAALTGAEPTAPPEPATPPRGREAAPLQSEAARPEPAQPPPPTEEPPPDASIYANWPMPPQSAPPPPPETRPGPPPPVDWRPQAPPPPPPVAPQPAPGIPPQYVPGESGWRMAPLVEEPAPPVRRRPTWLLVLVGILAGCMLVCAGLFVFALTPAGRDRLSNLSTQIVELATENAAEATQTPVP